MKKKIAILSCIVFLAAIGGFFVFKNYMPVTDKISDNEITRKFEVGGSMSDYVHYENASDMAKRSDLILVGKVTEDFIGAKNFDDRDNDSIYPSGYYTVRELKVSKFIKGYEDKVILAENAIIADYNGEQGFFTCDEAVTIAKKNVNYLFFLTKSYDDDSYFISGLWCGKINLEAKEKDLDEKKLDEDPVIADFKAQVLKEYRDDLIEYKRIKK